MQQKKSKTKVYLICYCKSFNDYMDEYVEIIKAYSRKELAVHKLIDFLNEEFDLKIREYTIEAIESELKRTDYTGWFIKEVTINNE